VPTPTVVAFSTSIVIARRTVASTPRRSRTARDANDRLERDARRARATPNERRTTNDERSNDRSRFEQI
jgi:hypothetical protein